MQNVLSNSNYYVSATSSGRIGGDYGTDTDDDRGALEAMVSTFKAFSKKYPTQSLMGMDSSTITSSFYYWQTISKPVTTSESCSATRCGGGFQWKAIVRTVYADADRRTISVVGKGEHFNKKLAMVMAQRNYFVKLTDLVCPRVLTQMDTVQGDVTQVSDVKENTIITQDTGIEVSNLYVGSAPRLDLVSTEKVHSFPTIMNRWMPYNTYQVTTSMGQGTTLFDINIPEIFYTDTVTPNLSQFRNFVFGELDIEMRIMINAHRFQAGKLVLALFPDPFQGLNTRTTFSSAVQLQHVIVDMNGNNHGVLEIPFRYRRPMLRLVSNPATNKGVRAGVYAKVACFILSPLVTGPGQALTCDVRTFFRFKHANLAGMSYQVNVQMDDVIKLGQSFNRTLKCAEETLIRAGKLINWDKPQCIDNVVQTVPRPRLNFTSGVGLSDATQLRVNPYATDILPNALYREGDPVTVHDIARIWGYYTSFGWSVTDAPGTPIWSYLIDPAITTRPFPQVTDTGTPTPFNFINGLYNFWSGPIELRFDFVSNDFITGTVQISFEPNRPANTELQSQSAYTKTFHLGEQKSVTFTIPYINDNVMRRTGVEPFNYFNLTTGNFPSQAEALAVKMLPRNTLSVRVVNAMRSVATTAQTINVLVFMRAGEEYINLTPVMGTWETMGITQNDLTVFPGTFPTTIAMTNRLASVPDIYQEVNYNHKIAYNDKVEADVRPNLLREVLSETDDLEKKKPDGSYEKKFKGIGKYIDPAGKRATYTPVKYQMDTGEKENLDPTEDFSQGAERRNLVVTDRHDNIIDLMRRPVCLWRDVQLTSTNRGTTGTYNNFWVPVMPPGPMWYPQSTTDTDANTFNPFIFKSPQGCLAACFRHWRGSLRFTFVVRGTTSPVYITYVPHNGLLLFGNRTQPRATGGRRSIQAGPENFGLVTEMIIPSVNPTLVLEVPYENEFDYMLTSEDNRSLNYAWREKNAYNNGHLVLNTMGSDCFMDIFVSAGDSFYLCDFIGTYVTRSAIPNSLPSDNNPSVGTVFSASEIKGFLIKDLRKASKVQFQMDRLTGIYNSIIDSPLFIPAAALTSTVAGPAIVEAAGKLKMARMVESTSEVYNMVVDAVTKQITSLFEGIREMFGGLSAVAFVSECVIDVIILVRNFDITGIVLSTFKMICKLFKVDFTAVIPFLGNLVSSVKALFYGTPATQSDSDDVSEQLSTSSDAELTFVGLIASFLGTVLRVTYTAHDIQSFMSGLCFSFTDFRTIGYFNSVHTFIKNFYDSIKRMLMKAFGYATPSEKAYQYLKERNLSLYEFVRNAHKVIAPLNLGACTNMQFRMLYWKTVMEAQTLKEILVCLPAKQANSNLLKVCGDVLNHVREFGNQFVYSPVRYVPFVLCLEGEPGIGKSFVTDSLATELLSAIQYKSATGSEIYTRKATDKHWNGFNGQKVILMDDIFNLSSPEFIGVTLSDLYALKTTALFIPEFASLQDKGRPENPYFVLQTTNCPFPDNVLDSIAHCKKAIYRRRDVLVKMELKAEYRQIPMEAIPPEVLQKKDHVEFRYYSDVTESKSLSSKAVSFERFIRDMKERALNYHVQESQCVKARYDEIRKRMCGEARLMRSNVNPFELFDNIKSSVEYEFSSGNGWLPSEVLLNQLDAICKEVELVQQAPSQVLVELGESSTPVTQMDWSLTSYLPQIMNDVTLFCGTSLIRLLKWIKTRLLSPGVCSVCGDEGLCLATCKKQHNVCYKHTINNICGASDNGTTCGETVYYKLSGPVLFVFHSIRSLLRGITNITQDILQIVMEIYSFLGPLSPIFCAISNTFKLFMEYQHKKVVPLANVACVLIDSAYGFNGKRALLLNTPTTQGPIYYGHSPSFMNQGVDVLQQLDITINDSALKEQFEPNARIKQRCNHKLLLAERLQARFIDGMWDVQTTTGRVRIPDSICKDCTLTPSQYSTFMEEWYQDHYQNIGEQVVRILDVQGDIYKCLPRAFKPSVVDVSTDELLEGCEESVLGTLIRWLGYVAKGLLAYYAVSRAYRYLCPDIPMGQIEGSGDLQTRHFQQKRETIPKTQKIVTQSDDFDSCLDAKVVNNGVSLFLYYKNGQTLRLALTGLCERIALFPRHYYLKIQATLSDIDCMKISRANNPMLMTTYTFDKRDFLISSTSDIAIFYMPPSQPLFKNIVKFLQREDDLRKPMADTGRLVRLPSTSTPYVSLVPLEFKGFERNTQIDGDDTYIQSDSLTYNYSSEGACGSLVLKNNSQRPIVGMHFAGCGKGSDGVGYAILLTQEMVSEIPKRTRVKEQADFPTVAPASESSFLMTEDVLVDYVGVADRGVYMPSKSKIIPSKIQGMLEEPVRTQPCYLAKVDGYEHEHTPLVAGCMKHGKLTEDFSSSQLQEAADYIQDKFLDVLKPRIVPCKHLTVSEAISGFDGVDGYDPMKLDTSIGYPLNTCGVVSKRDDIQIDRTDPNNVVVTVSERVSTMYDEDMQLRAQGIVAPTIFTAFLKDERKPIEKVKKLGATRIFLMSSAHYTIAKRQMYLHYTAAQYNARNNSYSAVGIRCDSPEWGILFNKLMAKGPNIFTLDYSNFGPGFNAGVNHVIQHRVKKWLLANVDYGEFQYAEEVLDSMIEEHVNSAHIMKDLIYKQVCGGPSGDPCTVNHNSDVNAMYIILAWMHLFKENRKVLNVEASAMWNEFEDHVYFKVYGDDVIASVSDKWRDFFNANTISQYFATKKIVATDASKSTEVIPYTSIWEATFLKRSFKKHPLWPGEYLAPLSKQTIFETGQWIWKCENQKDATRVNAEAALRQAYTHGEGFFLDFKSQVNRALTRAKIPPVSLTWKHVDEDYFPNYY